MELHMQVIHSRDFVNIDATGHINKDISISLLEKIVREHPLGSDDLLIDLRDTQGNPAYTIIDIVQIVTFMLEHYEAFRKKIAILVQSERRKYPGFFEDYSYNRGLNAQIFESYEEAIKWLMGMKSE